MPGGQGGPRFPGFGVRRGFAIWGPFPVQAPDNAPETWTSLNKNLALHTALPVVDGFGSFVFTHGHFGFQKQSAAPVCMILMIFLEARPRAGAIKATPATDLMVFPAVPDHSRPQVRLALSCRPRLGFGSRGLVVRSLRHLPMNSRIQGGLLPDFSRAPGGLTSGRRADSPPNPQHRGRMPEELVPQRCA